MRHGGSRLIAAFLVAMVVMVVCTSREAGAYTVKEFSNGGFLNIDYQVQAREAWRGIGSGTDGTDSTQDFYLRRNRLSFLGAVNDTFGFALQLEYNGGQRIGDLSVAADDSKYEMKVLDAYLTATVSNALQIRAGKTKHILTREVQEGCFDPLSADRSLFINGPFKDKRTRDNGLVAFGNLHNDMFQYRLAVMQGNNFGNNKPSDIGYRYSGRAHVSLFDPESGFGYRGSYLGKKKVLTLGAGYEVESSAVYASGTTGAQDYKAYTYDVFYENPTDFGVFTVSAAYLKEDFGEAGMRGVVDAQGIDGEKNGYYWKAAYMIGKFQIFERYENWSFAELNGVIGQKIKWTASGINYYIKGQDLRVTLEFSKNDFSDAASRDFRTMIVQVQARF